MPRKQVSPWVEIEHYIDTFRISSDRVRVVMYAVVIACFIIAGLQWSIRAESWPRQRIEKEWMTYHDARARHDRRLEPGGAVEPGVPGPRRDIEERRRQQDEESAHSTHIDLLDEYSKEYIRRFGIVNIPLFGTNFDINDLGVVGGTTLALLSLLLLFCVARQHENFYLCAFKVRRLLASDDDHERGDSDANFLYHALAMTQVLNHPPSLARWQVGAGARVLTICRMFTFFLPAFVFAFVVRADLRSSDLADPTQWEMCVEYALLVILLLENFFATIYVSACQYKWNDLFYEINPRLEYTPHSRWTRWTDWKLRPRKDEDVDGLVTATHEPRPLPDDETRTGAASATHTIALRNRTSIDDKERRRMAVELHRRLRRQARGTRFADGGNIKFNEPEVLGNEHRDGHWTMHVRVPYIKKVRVDRGLRRDDSKENTADSKNSD
jgi:hypothetical protein